MTTMTATWFSPNLLPIGFTVPHAMMRLTPGAQAKWVSTLDFTPECELIAPVVAAIHAAAKRKKLQLVVEPVHWRIAEGNERVELCRIGGSYYNELSQSWHKHQQWDQVGIRRPDDPFYSVVVSIGRSGSFYITRLVELKSNTKEVGPVAIVKGRERRATSITGSIAAMAKKVVQSQFITEELLVAAVRSYLREVPRMMKEYFLKSEAQTNMAAADVLTRTVLRDEMLEALLQMALGNPVPELSTQLRDTLVDMHNKRMELGVQKDTSLLTDYAVAVCSFGESNHGYAIGVGSDGDWVEFRRIAALEELPPSVVGRLQTVHINKPNLVGMPYSNRHLAGIGGVVTETYVTPKEGVVFVMVTEEEFSSVFGRE